MTTGKFLDYVKTTLESDEKALATIVKFLENAPPGSLSFSKKGNCLECKNIIYANGKKVRSKYIKLSERDLVNDLVKKAYYLDLKPKLESEIAVLRNCYDNFVPEEKYKLYENLSPERKLFTEPLFETVEEKVASFFAQEYIPNTSHPEGLMYETNKGELRRSKSERDISNALDSYEGILAYRYEPRIYLQTSRKYVHPDFVIINLKTGRVYYWEHFGGFGKDNYNSDYAFKMQNYMLEPLEFRERLLMTFESLDCPLQPRMIDTMIKQIIDSV